MLRPATRVTSLGIILVGVLVTLLALLADTLEIGTGQGFGYYQMIVLITGIVIMLIGLALLRPHRSPPPRDDDFEPES